MRHTIETKTTSWQLPELTYLVLRVVTCRTFLLTELNWHPTQLETPPIATCPFLCSKLEDLQAPSASYNIIPCLIQPRSCFNYSVLLYCPHDSRESVGFHQRKTQRYSFRQHSPLAGSHCFRGKAQWLAFNFIKLMLPFRKARPVSPHSGVTRGRHRCCRPAQHLPTGNVEALCSKHLCFRHFPRCFPLILQKIGENHSIFRILSVASC